MILITASGKKGAAPRKLAHEVDSILATGQVPAEAVDWIRCGQAAANKGIHRARRGSDVSVQLSVTQDAAGGWSLSLLVDESPQPGAR